jgi:hypothetical protein
MGMAHGTADITGVVIALDTCMVTGEVIVVVTVVVVIVVDEVVVDEGSWHYIQLCVGCPEGLMKNEGPFGMGSGSHCILASIADSRSFSI